MLELSDFGTNPHAREFGEHGVLYVRWGKASKGSAPKRRSVLTVFGWSVQVVEVSYKLEPGRPRNPKHTSEASRWVASSRPADPAQRSACRAR